MVTCQDREDIQDIYHQSPKLSKSKKQRKSKVSEEDDLAGMIVNAGKSINFREMLIIWILFLFIHTELFVERILSMFSGTVDDKSNMTMIGTVYASFVMMIGIIIIDMVFR